MPILTIEKIGKVYAKDKENRYICCDYYEKGFGYMFTKCGGGGEKVVIIKEKVKGEQSQ